MRDWKPVLKGDVYCSLACGGGCKKAEYDRAVEEADKLCKKLGKNWKTRVWENLGWHWSVQLVSDKTSMEIHVYDESCWIDCRFNGRQYEEQFPTPEEAIQGIIRTAKEDAVAILNAVMKLENLSEVI